MLWQAQTVALEAFPAGCTWCILMSALRGG